MNWIFDNFLKLATRNELAEEILIRSKQIRRLREEIRKKEEEILSLKEEMTALLQRYRGGNE